MVWFGAPCGWLSSLQIVVSREIPSSWGGLPVCPPGLPLIQVPHILGGRRLTCSELSAFRVDGVVQDLPSSIFLDA